MKKRVNGNAKGKVGEREFAALLRSFGVDARRGQQFCGGNGDADVVGMAGMHFEVKRREALNIHASYDQAVRDAKASGDIPAVAFRRNRGIWLLTLSVEDFLRLVQLIEQFDSDCV
jgi:Holliday junction resolvase